VRYVLEGSVRKADAHIRVTSELVETESGTHIWADRYDAHVTDTFAVQDEIAHAVSIVIAPAVVDAERHRAARRPPDNQDSWIAYQRGLWHLSKAKILKTTRRRNNALGKRSQRTLLSLAAAAGLH
jgi:hypothetical protein